MYTKGQSDKRRMDFFRDQHGRVWKGNIEIATGDPCETLSPEGWTAPKAPSWMQGALVPPEDCRDMVPMPERNVKGYQVRINYQKWMNAVDDAERQYVEKVHAFAMGMAGGGDVQALLDNPTPALKQLAGPRPFPPREFIEACAAGNAWALGNSDTVPSKAESIVASLKPLITAKRRAADQSVDPFADDAEGVPQAEAVMEFAGVADPFKDDTPAAVEQSVRPRRK